MNDRLLDPDQLAAKLAVPKSWVYAQTRKKGPEAIPRLRVGKYVRFRESDVLAFRRP